MASDGGGGGGGGGGGAGRAVPPSWGQAAAMGQDKARELLREGAAVLLRGVPAGTDLGLDYMSWTVGERFLGVKMLPPGPHFLHWAARDASGGGAFCFLAKGDVLVRRWDGAAPAAEPREDEPRLADAARRGEFDRGLAPYPLDTLRRWRTLSCRITARTARRVSPPGERALRFAGVPAVEVPPGATPEEVTALHRDRSACLARLVDGAMGGDEAEVLGELQAAFVAFFVGHSYEGFEQWKALLVLLCGCEEAVARRGELYAGLAAALAAQLGEVPADFFRDPLAGAEKSFLLACASDLFEIVAETPDKGAELVAAMRGLAAVMRRRFAWHSPFFYHTTAEAYLEQHDQGDEFAPVIANLEELNLGGGGGGSPS